MSRLRRLTSLLVLLGLGPSLSLSIPRKAGHRTVVVPLTSAQLHPRANSSTPNSGLSAGAKAGIAIGAILCAVLFALIFGVIRWLYIIRQKSLGRRQGTPIEGEHPNLPELAPNEKGFKRWLGGMWRAELDGVSQPVEIDGTSRPVEIDGRARPVIVVSGPPDEEADSISNTVHFQKRAGVAVG